VFRDPAVRRLFVALALHQGWTDLATLAAFLGVSPRTVRRDRAIGVVEEHLDAAALCLGDERLTRPFASEVRALGLPSLDR
jgi:hypothetical protein